MYRGRELKPLIREHMLSPSQACYGVSPEMPIDPEMPRTGKGDPKSSQMTLCTGADVKDAWWGSPLSDEGRIAIIYSYVQDRKWKEAASLMGLTRREFVELASGAIEEMCHYLNRTERRDGH